MKNIIHSICLWKLPWFRPIMRMASGAAQLQSDVRVSAQPSSVTATCCQRASRGESHTRSSISPHASGQAMLVALKSRFFSGLNPDMLK